MLANELLAAWEAPVDMADPIDRAHRLNVGRVGWWLGLPPLSGAIRFYDLMGLGHGLLITPGATTIRWQSAYRPGGMSFLNVPNQGTGNRVDVPNAPSLNPTAAITVAAWLKWASNLTNRPIVAKWGTSFSYVLLVNPTLTDKLSFIIRSGGSSFTATTTLTWNGPWHRVVGTFDGANVQIYVDGLLAGTPAARTGTLDTTTDTLTFGTYSDHLVAGNSFVGSFDDISISNRAWSADEVAEDYDLSRRGYPGVLNRRMPPGVFTAIPVATPALALVDEGMRHITITRW